MKTLLTLRRAYDPAGPDDGWRVYVDKLWPRGLSHETFHYDEWDKDVAPSASLRGWFHADPDTRWEEFETKYRAELKANPAFATLASSLMAHTKATLLYSSRDRVRDNAHVLLDTLLQCYPSDFCTE